MGERTSIRLIVLVILLLAIGAGALPFYGPRAMALGGAYTALADDESSVFYNPAAMAGARDLFGFVPSFSLVSDDRITEAVNGFYRARGEIYDSIPEWIDGPEDLDPLISAVKSGRDYLASIDDGSAGVSGYLSYGAGVMLGPLAFTWIGTGNGQVAFEPDSNPGRLVPSSLLNNPLVVAYLYEEDILDTEQLMTLWPTYPDPAGFLGDRPGNGVGLDDNRSTARLANDARQDLILTYANYLYRADDDEWAVSVGVNIKYIITQAYRTSFSASDEELGTTGPLWITERLLGVRPVVGSTFSADLGLHARLTRFASLGLLARDVIPQTISWREPVYGAPQKLEPHWRLGVAGHIIPDWLTLTVDLDLQESSGAFSPQQDLCLGVRGLLPGGVFWLGAGMRHNLADAEQPNLYTVGAGAHVYGFRFDLALGLGSIDFSGEENTYFSASAALGFSM